jgi:hypothetical protein
MSKTEQTSDNHEQGNDCIADVIRWVANEIPPPNKTKQYLVCRNGRVEIHDWFYRDGIGYWWNYLGITHWAEIPKPPCV